MLALSASSMIRVAKLPRGNSSMTSLRLISESGDVIGMGNFYENTYNITPAHTNDVHAAIIDNPDIEVITPSGGERRKAKTIVVSDVLKLKAQKSFFPIFFNASTKVVGSK
jgi:hypothetical protein